MVQMHDLPITEQEFYQLSNHSGSFLICGQTHNIKSLKANVNHSATVATTM